MKALDPQLIPQEPLEPIEQFLARMRADRKEALAIVRGNYGRLPGGCHRYGWRMCDHHGTENVAPENWGRRE